MSGPPFPGSPQGFPQVTVQGHPDDVLDFLIEYCGGDKYHAEELLDTAVIWPNGSVQGRPPVVQVSGLDWVPRADR